jgi:hypothetical protein
MFPRGTVCFATKARNRERMRRRLSERFANDSLSLSLVNTRIAVRPGKGRSRAMQV